MFLAPLDPASAEHSAALAATWNDASAADLAVDEGFVQFNLRANSGGAQAGRLAVEGGQVMGFALASCVPDEPAAAPRDLGWIDAIAVRRKAQGRGVGGLLLAWAEEWLGHRGCSRIRLGGSIRPFAPGLPEGADGEPFFAARGYVAQPGKPFDWDLAADLALPPPALPSMPADGEVRAAAPGDEDALLAFLTREFPARWRYEYLESRRDGGPVSDFVLLWKDGLVHGFANQTFQENSWRPINRFYMYRLPQPWGQMGPLGVSKDLRGQGYGAALMVGGLRRLRDMGVRGCVIDWTSLLAFYGKFGFAPYRRYAMLIKNAG